MKTFYDQNIKEVLKYFNTSQNGLSLIEAQKRLKKYGKNELAKNKKRNFFKIIINEFKNPILIILIIGGLFSFVSKDYIEAIAILIIILIDVLVGAIQEWRALKTTDALADLIKYETKVIRDNKEQKIYSTDLVIGDIVLLESGNKVGADLRIIDAQNLIIDESVLTGESHGVIKNSHKKTEASNIVYAGTVVIKGRAKAVVIKTGSDTAIGKIADTVSNMEDTPSPLSIRVNKLSKQISLLILVIAIILTILLYYNNVSGKEIFILVIALSVSAMPEGLPLALTMALTVSSSRMAKKNVIVKKLNSVEALGSCTVIASDKTGTLTLNEQTAKKIVLPSQEEINITGSGYNDIGKINYPAQKEKAIKDIIFQGIINTEAVLKKENNKFKYFGDTIDVAFLVLGLKAKVSKEPDLISKIPYESENQYSAAFYEDNNKKYCTVKGSTEKVLSFCDKMMINGKAVNIDKKALNNQNEKMAFNGYRVIALAKKEIELKKSYTEKDLNKLIFLGFVCFIDPIRKEAKPAIKKCKKAGIKVVMITGDHPLTAANIGKELALIKNEKNITTGEELEKYLQLGEKEFDNFIKDKTVFARVTPLNKLAIVESFKRQNEYIAVTGDGVNDAPAIKAANIGIAMGSGTDVAKDTADMIILDDNFKSIVEGIKYGRIAYSNIRKIVYLLLSCGAAEVLFFVLAILANLPIPLIAIQILWLNVVTDGLQDMALSFENHEDGVLEEKVSSPESTIFNKDLFFELLVSSLTIGLVVYGFWVFLMKNNVDIIVARTYIVTLMVFIQNVHVFNCRSEKRSAFSMPLNNKFLIFSIFGSIFLHIIVLKVDIFAQFLKITSIPLWHIFGIFILSLPLLIIMEGYKKLVYHK
ncbi:MAG: cation-transporting P-type ATPase [Bacilli bacterium]|nr:cation-transporting P-type ATPase [Bacilli bacterium]MDD3895734.1 cation-transporting P-type ATPase [Bacilli bacterium]MDD4407789.1 cation-transporting P-type ATPase [Bacilli bacterium]